MQSWTKSVFHVHRGRDEYNGLQSISKAVTNGQTGHRSRANSGGSYSIQPTASRSRGRRYVVSSISLGTDTGMNQMTGRTDSHFYMCLNTRDE